MLDDQWKVLGVQHAGIMAGVIVVGTAVEGNEFFAYHQGLAQLQVEHLLGQLGRRDDVSCHHQIAAAAGMEREFLLEVGDGKIAVVGLAQHGLPLLADGGDAHAQHGGGACISERHQVLANLVVVEQNDVACCLFHSVTVD